MPQTAPENSQQATITKLHLYPIKSMQGIEVDSITCLETGFQYDRDWVVVDAKNTFVTQRQIPKLASIKVALTQDEMIMSHPEHDALHIPLSREHLRTVSPSQVTIWKDLSMGLDEGQESQHWLGKVLGEFRGGSLRLLRFDEQHKRMVREKYTDNQNAHFKYADACPYLIVNSASLEALNAVLKEQGLQEIPMDRFRGNITITGIDAWQEYAGHTIKTNKVALRGEGACSRCPMTTINQFTGEIKEQGQPLTTLRDLDIPPGKPGAFFGMHATLLEGSGNHIKVGEKLTLLPA